MESHWFTLRSIRSLFFRFGSILTIASMLAGTFLAVQPLGKVSADADCMTLASGNWNDFTIWDCGVVPDQTLSVDILDNVTVNDSQEVGPLTIGDGTMSANLNVTGTLMVYGDVTINSNADFGASSGTVVIKDNLFNPGQPVYITEFDSNNPHTFYSLGVGPGARLVIQSQSPFIILDSLVVDGQLDSLQNEFIFDTGSNQTISTGFNTIFFNNLTKEGSSHDETLAFNHTGGVSVSGVLTLKGTASENLLLRCADCSSGTDQWWLNANGPQDVDYVDVQDSLAATPIQVHHWVDSGNNTGWQQVYDSTTTTITSNLSASSVVNQPVMVAVSVTSSGGTPTGTVTVSSGPDNCTITLPAASCDLTFTSAGDKTVTASYAGDENFAASDSAGTTHTVTAASTTTAITSDLSAPSAFNQAVTVVVSVTSSGGTPTGTVTVSSGPDNCSITLPAASCDLTFTSAGDKTITASYAGDGNFAASDSAGTTHTVTAASTTTTITSDLSASSVVNQPIPVAVSVTSAGGSPTGTVMVSSDTDTCTITLPAAFCLLTFTSAGDKTVSASYTGDGNFAASDSSATAHTVAAASTTTAITSDLSASTVVGQPVTIMVSVTTSESAPIVLGVAPTPTGIVTVTSGLDTCTITLPAASCDLIFTSAGDKTVTASYSGDSNFGASASAGTAHTVMPASTTTAITSDLSDASIVGQTVTVGVSVEFNSVKKKALSPSTKINGPTGTVTVSSGPDQCSITLPDLACDLTFTSAGDKTVTASYAGDGNFSASTSDGAAHTVTPAATTTTITTDLSNPSFLDLPISVGASVAVVAPGSGALAGTVTVSDGTNSCVISLPATSCTLQLSSLGPKTITATYHDAGGNFLDSSDSKSNTVKFRFIMPLIFNQVP